ncbi:MAG: hypothetical protein MJZ35_07745, partial [Bacteroidaceae bacterium]|nr:hypothetical protein [Bacteroidaceae bacterium]
MIKIKNEERINERTYEFIRITKIPYYNYHLIKSDSTSAARRCVPEATGQRAQGEREHRIQREEPRSCGFGAPAQKD